MGATTDTHGSRAGTRYVNKMSFGEASMPPGEKYRPYPDEFKAPRFNRTWPDAVIEKAPLWCSVDLRDGNQALATVMNIRQRKTLFKTLVRAGFRDIEVGFPSSNDVDRQFLRELIDEKRIPAWVRPQALVQCREDLIQKTISALEGTPQAVIHIYNSTSESQRRIVFGKDKAAITEIALKGVNWVKKYAAGTKTKISLEYSPESFTGTEMPFALEICAAVIKAWEPTPDNKIIINLPATVEHTTPNVYADQIEWMCRNLPERDSVIVSVHPHNDRGTAIAAAELAVMAGADRVEGTLFGNGERTGNLALVPVALNMFTQGVDPKLNLQNVPRLAKINYLCTGLDIDPRYPYAGDLVCMAYSGSHQDAIFKGKRQMDQAQKELWDVPYLPYDPRDIGREFDVIGINNQSGKGGVAYVMKNEFGFDMPKEMHPEFGKVIKSIADRTGERVPPADIIAAFNKEYFEVKGPYQLKSFATGAHVSGENTIQASIAFSIDGKEVFSHGIGNGPIDACCKAILASGAPRFEVLGYHEHDLGKGSNAQAVCYIRLRTKDGHPVWGVGIDSDTSKASILALFSGMNRLSKK